MVEFKGLINTDSLVKTLGEDRVKLNEPLSRHTSLKIGGPAELFFETRDSGDLIKAVRLARSFGVPVTVIGGGSNILVSDKGIAGLIIKNCGGKIEIRDKKFLGFRRHKVIQVDARWVESKAESLGSELVGLNYDESGFPEVEVAVDSGVNLQAAMFKLLDEGVTGLQWYARIPGSVGGAVYNNIHGGSHTLAEIVKEVVVLDDHGGIVKIPAREMRFAYDRSRIHKTGEVVLEVVLNLKRGEVEKARRVEREWRKRKSSQSFNSAGCVFKNITDKDREILGYPTTSVGYIVENILNMTGYAIGGAMISPDHHNFIVNTGKATAEDFLAVRDEISKRAKEMIGLELEDEIIRLGDFNY